jgi:hypothetical protein
MKASELIHLLETTIKHHGDYQVSVDVVDDGWHSPTSVSGVSVENIEGNNFTLINYER